MEYEFALAWAGGFFDGEGCITICKRGKGTGTHTIRLQVAQVDPRPIERIAALLGGRVYTYSSRVNDTRRPYFTWILEARQAETVLKKLRPYLFVKDAEADLALEFMASMPTWGNAHSRPDGAELERREGYRVRLMAMHGLQGKNQLRAA